MKNTNQKNKKQSSKTADKSGQAKVYKPLSKKNINLPYYIIFVFGTNIFGLPESCQSLSSLRARIFDGSHTCLWGGSCNARLRLSVEFVTDMVPGDVE